MFLQHLKKKMKKKKAAMMTNTYSRLGMTKQETNVEINGVEMKMMIDTGTLTDIMDKAAFQKIKQTQPIKFTEDRYQIFAYGSQS